MLNLYRIVHRRPIVSMRHCRASAVPHLHHHQSLMIIMILLFLELIPIHLIITLDRFRFFVTSFNQILHMRQTGSRRQLLSMIPSTQFVEVLLAVQRFAEEHRVQPIAWTKAAVSSHRIEFVGTWVVRLPTVLWVIFHVFILMQLKIS